MLPITLMEIVGQNQSEYFIENGKKIIPVKISYIQRETI